MLVAIRRPVEPPDGESVMATVISALGAVPNPSTCRPMANPGSGLEWWIRFPAMLYRM